MSESKAISGVGSESAGIIAYSDFGKPSIQTMPENRLSVFRESNPTSDTLVERLQTDSALAKTKTATGKLRTGKKDGEERVYRQYRKLMDTLVEELNKAPDYLIDGKMSDEGSTITAEVDELLCQVADCPWGEGESLRLVVALLRIPTRNARWTEPVVDFLQEAIRLLRVQYLIDQSTVEMCKTALKSHGLDVFRGSVTEPEVVRRYKIVEVGRNEQ